MITQAHPLDLTRIRAEVEQTLEEFLAEKDKHAIAPALFTRLLRGFLVAGGKRTRPLLCCLGWLAAGGAGDITPVLPAAASLELFHACALIHDDIMDDSDTRRGNPALHQQAAICHPDHPHRHRHGINTAILIGDLAFGWSYELFHTTSNLPVDRIARAWSLLDIMRCETLKGQYLDLCHAGNPSADLLEALQIIEYKTAKYTIERPLQLGATLAGADSGLLASLSAYALPLGEAFQLRDDLLGVFGEPTITGKPVLDDLRDGKHTALLAIAYQRATPRQAAELRTLTGNPRLDQIGADQIRKIIIGTAANTTIEQMITDRVRSAKRALDAAALPLHVDNALRGFTAAAAIRSA